MFPRSWKLNFYFVQNHVCCFKGDDCGGVFHRIIQQLVNGIIAPTSMPNMGMGPW